MGNGEAGVGHPTGGCKAPVAMPSATPAPAPTPGSHSSVPSNTPASSEGTSSPQHRPCPSIATTLQGSAWGIKPLPGRGAVCGRLGAVFEREVRGAGPLQRGYCSPAPSGPSCRPSTCRTGASWVRGSRPEAGGERPAANMGAAGGFPPPPAALPAMGPPFPPEQSLFVSASGGDGGHPAGASPPGPPGSHRHRLPRWSSELGPRWDGQGKRVTRPRSALTLWSMGGERGPGEMTPSPAPQNPSDAPRGPLLLLGDRRKRWEGEAGGRSPWGAAARPWVMEAGEEKARNWRRKAKNPTKAPRPPSSKPKGDAGGCSLRPRNEEG